MKAKERWLRYPQQIFIGMDQFLNALIPPFWTLSFADESLSARTWRAAKRGKRIGSFFLPIIDAFFFWQSDDAEVNALAGRIVSGHCERAYFKEKLRRDNAPEYR